MNILLATNYYLHESLGGTEVWVHGIAKNLIKLGHRVHVLCASNKNIIHKNGQLVEEVDEIDRVAITRILINKLAGPDPYTYSFNNPIIGSWFRNYLGQYPIDLIHVVEGATLTGSIIRVGLDSKIPILVTPTDYWFSCQRSTLIKGDNTICDGLADALKCLRCTNPMSRNGKIYKILALFHPKVREIILYWCQKPREDYIISPGLKIIARYDQRRRFLTSLLNQVDRITVPSIFLKNILLKNGVDSEKMIVLRHGLDIPDDYSLNLNKDIQDERRTTNFVYLGVLAPHKGVDVLIRAFLRARVPGRKLRIFGPLDRFPDFVEYLVNLASDSPDITFEGPVHRDDVYEVLKKADVMVLPSLWYENAPISILEAFFTRTPVIASRIGGIPELVIHNVNGLLFKAGNDVALSNIIKLLSSDSSLLSRLKAGISPIKTAENDVMEFEELYQGILRI